MSGTAARHSQKVEKLPIFSAEVYTMQSIKIGLSRCASKGETKKVRVGEGGNGIQACIQCMQDPRLHEISADYLVKDDDSCIINSMYEVRIMRSTTDLLPLAMRTFYINILVRKNSCLVISNCDPSQKRVMLFEALMFPL